MTPRLETERLILRGWRENDLDAFAAMMAAPEVARFLTSDGRPLSRAGAWGVMAMIAGHWALHGFGLFAVEEKTSGRFVGRIGPLRPEGWIGYELGWGLAPQAWGKGYAIEAARASGDWLFAHLPTDKMISLIHVDNARSQKVASRLGMKPGRETLHVGQPHVIWEIAREDWAASA